ncbi:MAG: hypothetical protein ACRDH1_05335 [Actinomycetota bacterium]
MAGVRARRKEGAVDGSLGIEAECPWCGQVQVEVADLRCEVEAHGTTEGLCEFACPVCTRLVLAPVPRAGVKTLRRLGAGPVRGAVPFELLERHPEAPLSWDDILDAHVALGRGCCPQDELSGELPMMPGSAPAGGVVASDG